MNEYLFHPKYIYLDIASLVHNLELVHIFWMHNIHVNRKNIICINKWKKIGTSPVMQLARETASLPIRSSRSLKRGRVKPKPQAVLTPSPPPSFFTISFLSPLYRIKKQQHPLPLSKASPIKQNPLQFFCFVINIIITIIIYIGFQAKKNASPETFLRDPPEGR